LTVSVLNIYPSTATVGMNCVRVISTGAASLGACGNVRSSHGRYLSLWASLWAVLRGQKAIIKIIPIPCLTCSDPWQTTKILTSLRLSRMLASANKEPSILPMETKTKTKTKTKKKTKKKKRFNHL
jgi:hypothetical protein